MFADRIEAKWIDAFCEIFDRCAVKSGDTAAILSETQSVLGDIIGVIRASDADHCDRMIAVATNGT